LHANARICLRVICPQNKIKSHNFSLKQYLSTLLNEKVQSLTKAVDNYSKTHREASKLDANHNFF
jgi:hypothetical protein